MYRIKGMTGNEEIFNRKTVDIKDIDRSLSFFSQFFKKTFLKADR